jgi:hypothetical protein
MRRSRRRGQPYPKGTSPRRREPRRRRAGVPRAAILIGMAPHRGGRSSTSAADTAEAASRPISGEGCTAEANGRHLRRRPCFARPRTPQLTPIWIASAMFRPCEIRTRPAATSRRSRQAYIASWPLQSSFMSKDIVQVGKLLTELAYIGHRATLPSLAFSGCR